MNNPSASCMSLRTWLENRLIDEPEIAKEYGIYYSKPDGRMIITRWATANADF